jgi:hypothetical protein
VGILVSERDATVATFLLLATCAMSLVLVGVVPVRTDGAGRYLLCFGVQLFENHFASFGTVRLDPWFVVLVNPVSPAPASFASTKVSHPPRNRLP